MIADRLPSPIPTRDIAPRSGGSHPRIRVMVVDDSAIVRGLIVQMLETSPEIEVVARASNGQVALAEMDRIEIDLIVLDLEMPVMDGMTALPLILAKQPGLPVIVASTLSRRNARISLEALQRGAADYIPKPETGTLVNADDFRRQLLETVQALGRRSRGHAPVQTPTARCPPYASAPTGARPAAAYACV